MAMPQVAAILVLGQTGDVVVSSPPLLAPGSFAYQHYFSLHRDNGTIGPVIGRPSRDRNDDRWLIPVSQRLETSTGEFAGVVVVCTESAYFEEFYAALAADALDVIALHSLDGTLMARRPADDAMIGRSVADSPMFRRIVDELPRGRAEDLLMFDGQTRIASYTSVSGFPLLVVVAIARSGIWQAWWQQSRWQILALSLIAPALGICAILLVRQFNGLQRLTDVLVRTRNRAERLAYQDELSGLANRRLFQDHLVRALARGRREDRRVAVLMLDLDRFKDINDTLGHEAGDHLLRSVAHRLSAVVRDSDTLARLGGDEFAILQTTSLNQPHQAASAAQRVMQALKAPFHLAGSEVHVATSIGIALFPDDSANPDELIKHADMALYDAKAKGRSRFSFFVKSMNDEIQARRGLEADLRRAVEDGGLCLLYQAQVELKHAQIVGFEALLRWHHPTRGTLLPSYFIPLAEATGLIRPLGAWILQQACLEAQGWQERGLPTGVAINLSTAQLHEDLPSLVDSALVRSGLEASRLELELTESLFVEPSSTIEECLQRLAQRGIRIAIDDFGTRYSSLTYLKRFPIDKIKIDRSFVQEIGKNSDDEAIVRAIVALGHNLGKRVIAEGVETEDQLRFLLRLGCDEAQGFLFGQPRSPEQVALELIEGERFQDDRSRYDGTTAFTVARRASNRARHRHPLRLVGPG